MVQALILAGGKGKRLSAITRGGQKVVVNIAGSPFIQRIIEQLWSQGISSISIAIGYKGNEVVSALRGMDNFDTINFIEEKSPLGTGGAICNALHHLNAKELLVLNGDTYNDVSYVEFLEKHREVSPDISILTSFIDNTERYGKLEIGEAGFVEAFLEKNGESSPGWINAGGYLVNREVFKNIEIHPFSFEEHLQNNVKSLNIYQHASSGYFIDIGVPDDYYKFKKEVE